MAKTAVTKELPAAIAIATGSEASADKVTNEPIGDVVDVLPLADPGAGDSRSVVEIFRPQITVTAKAGPRRRAGYAFGPVPVTLTLAELGEDAEALITAFKADPFLQVGWGN